MELTINNLDKSVTFELEFYTKKCEMRQYIGNIVSVLVDINFGIYGYRVKYFDNYMNQEKFLSFIDKGINLQHIGTQELGENIEILNMVNNECI